MAENGLIGAAGGLPWRLPDDMRHFMDTTMGKPVIMGRKTFESMKAALPGRANIVLTRDREWQREGAEVVADLDAALALGEARAVADGVDEVMVIGGADIYALALPRATRLYVTHVHAAPEGDVYFPDIDFSGWVCEHESRHEADERHSAAFTIRVYHPAG